MLCDMRGRLSFVPTVPRGNGYEGCMSGATYKLVCGCCQQLWATLQRGIMLARRLALPCSVFLLLGIILSACATQGSKTRVQGFVHLPIADSERSYGCMLYVPPDHDPRSASPLIVFLHGYGERGDDGEKVLEAGIAKAIESNPERFPCLVLMPQCPDDSWWGKINSARFTGMKDATPVIDLALAETLKQYRIDKNRIVLTGLSMGGYGTYYYAAHHPDTFAAVLPICGPAYPDGVQAIADIPIRIFHGDADTTVSPDDSRAMVKALREAGADVAYTEYPGLNHNSWDEAYADPETIAWLLNAKRR